MCYNLSAMGDTDTKDEIAVFGGGCFWCTEAIFKMLRGVKSVLSGYTGGTTINPTYEEVSTGETGHVESIKIKFNPSEISYRDLLTVFFGTHDPTTKNRQGNDIGTQYRSAVFYTTPKQKEEAEAFIKELNTSSAEGASVVTEVVPFDLFYVAEKYHKDYYDNNKEAPYCQLVINPKLKKVQDNFAEFLKNQPKM